MVSREHNKLYSSSSWYYGNTTNCTHPQVGINTTNCTHPQVGITGTQETVLILQLVLREHNKLYSSSSWYYWNTKNFTQPEFGITRTQQTELILTGTQQTVLILTGTQQTVLILTGTQQTVVLFNLVLREHNKLYSSSREYSKLSTQIGIRRTQQTYKHTYNH